MQPKRITPLAPQEAEAVSPEALAALYKVVGDRYAAVAADTPQIPGQMTSRREEQWRANINTLNLYGFTLRTLEDLLGLPYSHR